MDLGSIYQIIWLFLRSLLLIHLTGLNLGLWREPQNELVQFVQYVISICLMLNALGVVWFIVSLILH